MLLYCRTAGRWQGALVAIKIVEHSLKGAAAEIEGARESLLAASISHPNVVRSYITLASSTVGCLTCLMLLS